MDRAAHLPAASVEIFGRSTTEDLRRRPDRRCGRVAGSADAVPAGELALALVDVGDDLARDANWGSLHLVFRVM